MLKFFCRLAGCPAAGSAAAFALAACLLSGCETRHPAATAAAPASAAPTQLPTAPPAAPAPAVPDTVDYTRAFDRRPGPADSLVEIGGRRYHLRVQVSTDSARAIDCVSAGSVGPAFAAPGAAAQAAGMVRGYEETYAFGLRDSANRQVIFRRELRKPDFYAVAPRDIVVVCNMPRPSYLGYSAGLDALAFVCYLGIPYSDVGYQATLLLDRRGRVRALSAGGAAYSGAADCDPRVAPGGRAVLTCTEVLRAGRPPLRLGKPHAELRAARFLTDTTLLVLYEYGDYRRPRPAPELADSAEAGDPHVTAPLAEPLEFVSTPAQRRLPTAFVLSTGGRVLRRFRLAPSFTMAAVLTRFLVKPARTYVFVEDNEAGGKLVLVPKAHPDQVTELPLRGLPRFRPPRRPHEQPYEVRSDLARGRLYIDTLRPRAVRYQPLPRE